MQNKKEVINYKTDNGKSVVFNNHSKAVFKPSIEKKIQNCLVEIKEIYGDKPVSRLSSLDHCLYSKASRIAKRAGYHDYLAMVSDYGFPILFQGKTYTESIFKTKVDHPIGSELLIVVGKSLMMLNVLYPDKNIVYLDIKYPTLEEVIREISVEAGYHNFFFFLENYGFTTVSVV